MNAPHYDVATLLDDNAIGTLATDLFGGEWGKPDRQILILDGPGIPSELKTLFENPSIQILVRGDKDEAARTVYTTAKAVYDFLVAQTDSVTINGCEYKGFEVRTNITPLGMDESQRHIYSMNFLTWRGV